MLASESKSKTDATLLAYLTLVYVVVFVGYLGVRRGLSTWYAGLIHPSGALPAWAVGPLWAAVCLLLGYYAWRLFTAEASRGRTATLALFTLQLVLHSAWAWLLFGLQRPVPAMVVLGCAGAAALATAAIGLRVRSGLTATLVPYLLWLGYVGFLSHALWVLNDQRGDGVGKIETIIQPGP